MTTKQQYVTQAREANPQPQYRIVNGEQIKLTDDEYETALNAWAEMRVTQDKYVDEQTKTKQSALDKLKALGLSDEEIKVLLA